MRAATSSSHLDEAKVRAIAERLVREEVVSVAVCLLHAWLNPVHEKRVGEILRTHAPDLVISLSSEVCPEFREYFRASTTIINACVRPVLARYIASIEERLRRRNVSAELLIMQSSGGVLTFATGAEKPVYMVESGPAAGVIVSNHIAGGLGHRNAISFDMGGTTAKVGLILDGRPNITKEYEVGAQGRARHRPGPRERVPDPDPGHRSGRDRGGRRQHRLGRFGGGFSGSDPRARARTRGPICYGKGGEEPTITDANLVLGRLNPEFFLGGEMGLRAEAAREGIVRRCAEPMGMDASLARTGSSRSRTRR